MINLKKEVEKRESCDLNFFLDELDADYTLEEKLF